MLEQRRRARLVGAAGQCPAGRPSAVGSRHGGARADHRSGSSRHGAPRSPRSTTPARTAASTSPIRWWATDRWTSSSCRATSRTSTRGGRRAVGSAGATVGVVLVGDPLRQAGDGTLGPARPRRRRGMGGGHGSGARRGRFRAGGPARGHRRRAHRSILFAPRPTPIVCVRSCSTACSPAAAGRPRLPRSGSGRRTSTRARRRLHRGSMGLRRRSPAATARA